VVKYMKKIIPLLLFLILTFSTFAQRLTTVGIMPFETSGDGVDENDAEEVVKMIAEELGSWGVMTILTGEQARTAEYLVRGQVSRQDNQFVIEASVSDPRTGRILNTAHASASSPRAIHRESLCVQIAENIPYPNYLLGKWQSTINMIDGPVICILDFRSDRTVRVERFDTWEHNGANSLKYQAIGSGTYSYSGYLRRTVTIDRREIVTDATVGISLTLEDALPKYRTVSAGGLRVLFDEEKLNLELSYGGIPCGENHSGASVYPSRNVYYSKFTKIQ